MNPTIFKWSSKVGVVALLFALSSPCRANIVAPYTADTNTLHLWHLDELVTPCIDSVASGGTNLAGLAGGATLGNASFTGFGNALNTAPGGALKGDLLSPSPTAANVTIQVADPVTGAFTFEAVVQIGFDPTVNSTAAYEILSGESGSNPNRIFQWRIAPKGFTLIAGIVATNGPFLTFENIRGGSAGQGSIYAPIPTTGPDAIVSNGWYHVAVTYNGSPSTPGNFVMYWTAMDPSRISCDPLTINSAVTTLTGLNPLSTITTPFMLGNQARSKNGNFLGLIDEVRISKVAQPVTGMMFAPACVAIVTNPTTNTLAAAGDNVSLSVVAGGTGTLTYQWRFNNNNILSTTNSTATNLTLVLSNITTQQAGNYQVIVANGACTATSTVATVQVGGVLAGLFNTGVNDSGALLPGGASDPHWQLAQSGDPNFPGPSAFVVSSPVSAWLANGPSSQWITPGDGGNIAGGLYTYQTTFLVDTFDPATAQITGGWISDNQGQNIILNGTSLNITNTTSLAGFTTFAITNGFVPGLNVLQCIVSNNPGGGNNPSGLRLQARGVALPLAPTAPQIVNAPVPVTTQTLQSASFTVGAFGSAPLTYQWFFGASPLGGQTSRTLTLANLTTGQSGNYTVVVSNSVGVTNATVALSVTQPPAVTWLGFTTGDWDTATTNWLDSVNLTNTTFTMLDDVIFDGNGSGQPIVNLTEPLTLNSLSVNAANDYTFSSTTGTGSLTGQFALTKDNTGTLILDTTNNYTGSTVILNGTIQVGNNDANGTLGTGTITNNAALVFKRTDTAFLTPSISGSGSLTMAGTGVLALTGNNSYTGPTFVQSGQINVRSGTGLGTVDSGTTVVDGAQIFIDFGINIGAEPLTIGGFGLASDGVLRKGGATATTFGGPITLSDAAGIGVDANSSLTLTNPAAITSADIPLSVQCLTGGTLNITGKISLGAGSVTEFGSGIVTLTSLSNAWTGGTTINTGTTLQIGDGGNDGSYGVGGGTSDNGTLIINSSNNITLSDSIFGGGLLTQAGAGVLTIPNANSGFSGAIHLNGFGSLVPGDNAAFGSGILTIGLAQTDTSKLVLNGGIVLPNQINIFPRAFGVSNNPANVQNVSGVNVLNPPVAIAIPSGGNLLTLESDSGDLILSNSATAIISAGVGRDFVMKGAGNGEIYGSITTQAGASVLIWKLDSGTWTLWGANAPGAGTTVSNGTLIINGSMDTNLITVAGGTLGGTGVIAGSVLVNSGATFAPTIASLGPIGAMTINNTLTLQAGSTTAVQINKSTAANDQVIGLSNVVCGGSLVVNNLGGTLAAGDSFPLFVATNYAGAFTSITPATPGAGLRWNLSSPGVDGTLRVISTNISKPTITGVTSSGSAITLAATGGTAGGPVLLLSSTNVNAPLSSWTRVSTNVFDGTGHLSVTNLIAPTGSKFFALQAQ